MSHSPIHNCPNCTCGMIELTWSDRAAFVFPGDAEGIADAIVSCAFDHSYDRTDTGVPYGLPDKISVVCAEIVARRLDAFYPGWKDSTIPWSKDSDEEEERLRQELVTRLNKILRDTMFDDSTLEDALDEVVRLARKHRGAEIDAGACGTRTDFDNMRKAEEAFHDAKDAFLARFAGDVGALENERAKVSGLLAALKQATARINAVKAAVFEG